MGVNKIFAIILFIAGIGLLLFGACANVTLGYFIPGNDPLTTWGIIWRIGLGLLLIVLAVVLNNLESSVKRSTDGY